VPPIDSTHRAARRSGSFSAAKSKGFGSTFVASLGFGSVFGGVIVTFLSLTSTLLPSGTSMRAISFPSRSRTMMMTPATIRAATPASPAATSGQRSGLRRFAFGWGWGDATGFSASVMSISAQGLSTGYVR